LSRGAGRDVDALVARLRDQARACALLGSPMYAALVADDVAAAGVCREVLAGHEDDPGPSALGLRLMGSVHRLVLERRAGALAAYYPSVGGVWDPVGAWPAFRHLLRARADEVREWLPHPPQTNEVGRAAALMGGLLRIGEERRMPVRLLEIGSSGGLNLHADSYAYTGSGSVRQGPADAALTLEDAWAGRPLEAWPDLSIVERVGSDPSPVDVTTTDGRLRLTAYVWPDQTVRLQRLRAALEVAADNPVVIRRQDAAHFVADLAPVEGRLTVLWHSVMWQYLDAEEQRAVAARIAAAGAEAGATSPLAHLSLEPVRRTPDGEHEFLVVLQQWPGGSRRVLGHSGGHGLPTTWE
jgi:hypothetical protein